MPRWIPEYHINTIFSTLTENNMHGQDSLKQYFKVQARATSSFTWSDKVLESNEDFSLQMATDNKHLDASRPKNKPSEQSECSYEAESINA